MKLSVIGASGRCGIWVTRLAVDRGHDVVALARPGSAVPVEGARIVRGRVLEENGPLDEVVAGRDAVLSCVGVQRTGVFPWAPLASPPDVATRTARRAIAAMRRHGVSRLVAISAAGVRDSEARSNAVIRALVRWSNVGVSYRDLARMEEELAASERDWLAVRPVTLVNGEPTGRAREIDFYRTRSTVRRADVATWMLDAVEAAPPFPRRTPMLGGGG